MFKKLKLRLTFICTLITGIILSAMAISALYISETQLRKQNDQSFLELFQTVTYHLETETIINYDWLVQTERANSALLYIEDNGMPFAFKGIYIIGQERLTLVNKAKEQYAQDGQPESDIFTISSGFFDTYNCGIKMIPTPTGTLTVLLLKDLSDMSTQILWQRLSFLLLIILSEVLLFIFSWWFVGKTLKPIEIAREKQNDFVACASHELRSPIAVIKTTLSAIAVANETERIRFLDIADKEATRMAKLLDDLLLLASFDRRHSVETLQEVDCCDFLLELFEKYEGVARLNHQTLSLSLGEEDLPTIKCDHHRLHQLLSILIDNALTYTPSSGTIILTGKANKHKISISVIDNGPGIAHKEKENVFERFFSVDQAHTHKEHSGLGLSIAKEITSHYGWHIVLTDTPGGGSTFTIEIPNS